MTALLAGILLAGLTASAEGSAAQSGRKTHLLIVAGLGGEPSYRDRFHEWALAMHEAARSRFGVPEERIWYFGEDPDRDPDRMRGKSTKEEISRAFAELERRVAPGDQIYVLLLGHGSHGDGVSRIHLPGPDLTADDFAELLAPFSSQEIVFVNTASASGDYTAALSGENRIVVTATKSGFERNETLFGGYFVEAYSGDGADVDKNGQVSVLEAYEYARREVARVYEQENRLMTEHALLEDDGDGQGAHRPADAASRDGPRARSAFLLGGGGQEVSEAAGDPESAALYAEVRDLEQRIAALRNQKDSMTTELYLEELERLLVELALKKKAIEELKKP